MRDKDQHANLASDFVHGFIELALPEGESVVPGHILPARELVAGADADRRLIREVKMITKILLALALSAFVTEALAQSRTIYDSAGRDR